MSTESALRVPLLLILALALPDGAPAQERYRGMSVGVHYALETGSPFSSLETVTLAVAEVGLSYAIISGARWSLDFTPALMPLVVAFNNPLTPGTYRDGTWYIQHNAPRGTSYGSGIKPVGVTLVRSWGAVDFFGGVSGGVVLFDTPTPAANSRRRNYVGDLGAGLRLSLSERVDGFVGYRFSHLSNANSGEINPGIDSHFLSLGASVR